MAAMMRMMEARKGTPPFAPPFLKAGKLVIGQTANILLYLGLAPRAGAEAGSGAAMGASAAADDRRSRAGNSRHPSSARAVALLRGPAGSAKKRSEEFWNERVPKYLGYFEGLLKDNGGSYLTGRRLTYVDLSLFQIVEGLRYAFPNRMRAFERNIPGLIGLHDRVAARPNIKAYLASDRRIAFNEDGIFRHYKELDS